MGKMLEASQAAGNIQQMLSGAANTGMQQANFAQQGYMPTQAATPPSIPTRGGNLPGTFIRSSGNPAADEFMQKSFSDYTYSWGRRYAQLKKDNPNLKDREIEKMIGPRPSNVRSFDQISNYIGALVEDPAEKIHRYEIDTMRERHKLNVEMFGEQKALQIAMQDAQYKHEMDRDKQQFEYTAEGNKAGREWQSGENQADRAAVSADKKAMSDAQMAQINRQIEAGEPLTSEQIRQLKLQNDMSKKSLDSVEARTAAENRKKNADAKNALTISKANAIASLAGSMPMDTDAQIAEFNKIKKIIIDNYDAAIKVLDEALKEPATTPSGEATSDSTTPTNTTPTSETPTPGTLNPPMDLGGTNPATPKAPVTPKAPSRTVKDLMAEVERLQGEISSRFGEGGSALKENNADGKPYSWSGAYANAKEKVESKKRLAASKATYATALAKARAELEKAMKSLE